MKEETYDYPNLFVEIYRRRLACESMTPAGALLMLQRALSQGEINEAEFRQLFDEPMAPLLVNAPGGAS